MRILSCISASLEGNSIYSAHINEGTAFHGRCWLVFTWFHTYQKNGIVCRWYWQKFLKLEFANSTTTYVLIIRPSPPHGPPPWNDKIWQKWLCWKSWLMGRISQLFIKCLIINWRSVSLSFTGLRGRQKCFTIPELSLGDSHCLLTDRFLGCSRPGDGHEPLVVQFSVSAWASGEGSFLGSYYEVGVTKQFSSHIPLFLGGQKLEFPSIINPSKPREG